jgi:hypothetical protein
MKNFILAAIIALFPTMSSANACIEKEIFEAFIKTKFEMNLYSWAVTNGGKQTIWLYTNPHRHFATITVELSGCSTLMIPEDQLSFFRRKAPPSYNPNQQMPMTRGNGL